MKHHVEQERAALNGVAGRGEDHVGDHHVCGEAGDEHV
jgi:hypothetical protein